MPLFLQSFLPVTFPLVPSDQRPQMTSRMSRRVGIQILKVVGGFQSTGFDVLARALVDCTELVVAAAALAEFVFVVDSRTVGDLDGR